MDSQNRYLSGHQYLNNQSVGTIQNPNNQQMSSQNISYQQHRAAQKSNDLCQLNQQLGGGVGNQYSHQISSDANIRQQPQPYQPASNLSSAKQYRGPNDAQFHQQQQSESDSNQQTKHKPQFSQMSVESPKFALNNQQHTQSQLLQSTSQHQQRRVVAQGNSNSAAVQPDSSIIKQAQLAASNQIYQNNQSQLNLAQRQQKQDAQAVEKQPDQQKRQYGASHKQSYSQSRYVSQKNEKDIKQITKVDLKKINQLDNTIEEEDLEQQLRAAQIASNAQSRSQSYAAATRGQEELKVKESQHSSDGDADQEIEIKMAQGNKRNIPSSTYHQISGEELRYELFFAPRNNNKSSHNEYFGYKEMVQMYQAEIKRRWDQRAQIKDRYVFPRMNTKKYNEIKNADNIQTQQSNQNGSIQSHRRIHSKTPIMMAQLDPKVAQESQTPLMDSKGPSQNISLIPSEGKISPTKHRPKQSGGQQHLAKSMTSKDATLFKAAQQHQPAQIIGQHSLNSAKHIKNAMSSENPKKNIRGSKGIEHSHTQSAAIVSLVKNSQDFQKINLNSAELPQKINESKQQLLNGQQNAIPESKRERRNQQQIQNMMKYNQPQKQQQDHGSKNQQQLQGQQNMLQKAMKPQQFQQQSTYHLSRNGNLNDLQKPQIMSMQPQHRARVESQLMSYGGQLGPQLQHGTSQKQIQTNQNQNVKAHQGRSATQMQQHHPRPNNQSYIVQTSNHHQKQSIDSLKRMNQNNYIRNDSQKQAHKKAINQHYTQYNKSFVSKQYDVGGSNHVKVTNSNTRNAASIISFKSSKSPALNRPTNSKAADATTNGNISTTSKQQERTMTQQQMQVIGAIGEQVSQRPTTRSQIKSDQIPGSFTKFKSKVSVNKNSIISLNKYSINEQRSSQNDEVINEHSGIQIGQTSTRAAQRKNLQYQNYKAQVDQGQIISQGGVSNRKGAAVGQSQDNLQVRSNFKSHMNEQSNQQQVMRMVTNNTQIKKHADNGSSIGATIEKSEETQKPNNSVSPIKHKPFQQIYHQQPHHGNQHTDHATASHQLGHFRQAMSVQKTANVKANQQKSPTVNNATKAQVSIFDTSPDSLNFENSKKKHQDLQAKDNPLSYMVAYDEAQVQNPGLVKAVGQEQYRTQNNIDQINQKHGHSQASDLMRYQSQQQNDSQNRHYIINNAVMTHQLEFGNARSANQGLPQPKEMSIVLEAQRESLENIVESRESLHVDAQLINANSHQQASQIDYNGSLVAKQTSNSENVAPDPSHESINMISQPITVSEVQPEQNRVSMSGSYDRGSKKVLYSGGHSNQKVIKKEGTSKIIQKSMMTHHQTRSMQSIEQRPQSSKSHLRSDKHRNQVAHQQHQSQMFNEYNDTIDSINQIKNHRQRSSAINNNSSTFQSDHHQKIHSQSSSKHSKSFGKSQSKQVIANQQHAHALLANINNGLTTSAPQANRLIQKQIVGQNLNMNQMIGSRNVSQGLKNINSMKEQRLVGVSQDQIQAQNSNLNTLQAHHQTQSTITIQPSDMILGIQKQQQMVGKMAVKSQVQRQQQNNQSSMSIFKPANIIQSNKQNHSSSSASRNNQLIPQGQSSSLLYGGTQSSHQAQGSGSFIGSEQMNNHNQLIQQSQSSGNHHHFHSLSSQQEFLQNNQNSQFRRQVIREGSQQSMAGTSNQQTHIANHKQPSSSGSLITLNMAVGNYPVNQRQATDTNSYYGGVVTQSGQPVQSSYSIQIQPKIPKKKRQTNSYSGAVGQNVSSSSQGAINMNKMNSGHIGGLSSSYADGATAQIITTQGLAVGGLGQQQFHNQYQQIVHTSNKASGNAKQRGKNSSSSVNSQNSLKHNYQQSVGSAAMQHANNYSGSGFHQIIGQQQMQMASAKQAHLGPGGTSISHQSKSKSSTLYQQMQPGQQMSQPGPSGPISQMGILRNAQMKPKK